MKKVWSYTVVKHPARLRLGLSLVDYCVLDVIYQSQTNPLYSRGGWARVGVRKLSSFFGISSSGVSKIYARAEKMGLLEFSEDRNLKRTTAAFYELAYLDDADGGVHNVDGGVHNVDGGVHNVDGGVHNVDTYRTQSVHPGGTQSGHKKKYKRKEERKREYNARTPARDAEKKEVSPNSERGAATSPPVAPPPPSDEVTDLAQAMADFYEFDSEGNRQWFMMCRAVGVDPDLVPKIAVTSVWAGKMLSKHGIEYVRNWRRHTMAVQNWIKNEAKSIVDDQSIKQKRERAQHGADEATILGAVTAAIAERKKRY